MRALLRKPPSVYGLLAIGLILLIEPALPQYHFSLFWFSLGAAAAAVAIHGAFSWIIDRSIGWVLGAALVAAIAAIIWCASGTSAGPRKMESAGATQPPRIGTAPAQE